MDFSLLLVQIILLATPGLWCYYLINKYSGYGEVQPIKFYSLSLVYGLFAYLPYSLFVENSLIYSIIIKNELRANVTELAIAFFLSTIIAFVSIYLENKKGIFNLLRRLGITNKFGDEALFYNFLSSRSVVDNYVVLRNFDRGLVYQGYVNQYNLTTRSIEILMSDVKVYADSSDFLYSAEFIYLDLANTRYSIDILTLNSSSHIANSDIEP